MQRRILALAAPLMMLAIAACTTPFRADVARFQQMPAPQGQSFYIQPAEDEKSGGLEFATYSNLVAAELGDYGYTAARSAQDATLVVTMEYSVDNGRERVVATPGYHRGFWGHRSLFYSPYYSRRGWRSSYYHGWNDPFFGGGLGYPEVRSYTLYTSELDLRIARTADGEPVFEGRARARSRNDALTELVPNLVEAMFTNFPGNSGEEIRITVLPREEG